MGDLESDFVVLLDFHLGEKLLVLVDEQGFLDSQHQAELIGNGNQVRGELLNVDLHVLRFQEDILAPNGLQGLVPLLLLDSVLFQGVAQLQVHFFGLEDYGLILLRQRLDHENRIQPHDHKLEQLRVQYLARQLLKILFHLENVILLRVQL